jgi:hypothetical protein
MGPCIEIRCKFIIREVIQLYSLPIISFQEQTMSTKKLWFFILIVVILISAFSGRPAFTVTINEELMKACTEYDIDTVRNLLKNGADTNSVDRYKSSALHTASHLPSLIQ